MDSFSSRINRMEKAMSNFTWQASDDDSSATSRDTSVVTDTPPPAPVAIPFAAAPTDPHRPAATPSTPPTCPSESSKASPSGAFCCSCGGPSPAPCERAAFPAFKRGTSGASAISRGSKEASPLEEAQASQNQAPAQVLMSEPGPCASVNVRMQNLRP
jgi:hypothetical protein